MSRYIDADILADVLQMRIDKYPLHEDGITIQQDAIRAIYTGTLNGICDLLKALPPADVLVAKIWDGERLVVTTEEWENITEVIVQNNNVGKRFVER